MNRRDSLRTLGLSTLGALSAGTIAAGTLLEGCESAPTKVAPDTTLPTIDATGRQEFEMARDKTLLSQTFFDAHEKATITALADLIIPKDEKSGSASDAGVPDFIEFIVKDEPQHQLPMRGGLRWLDMECLGRYERDFLHCIPRQQLEVIGDIAYPSKARPDMQPGVTFFNKMRDLTAIGFFTSKMGIEDLGYKGNAPGKWTGVPVDVLKKYGLEGV